GLPEHHRHLGQCAARGAGVGPARDRLRPRRPAGADGARRDRLPRERRRPEGPARGDARADGCRDPRAGGTAGAQLRARRRRARALFGDPRHGDLPPAPQERAAARRAAPRRGRRSPRMKRLALSRAKHRSLAGHARISRWLARLLPYYEYDAGGFLRADGCPQDVAALREAGLDELAQRLAEKAPRTLERTGELREGLSDLAFTDAYRVPYPFRSHLRSRLRVGVLRDASEGVHLRDLDGNWSYDVTGSYGVDVFGLDFYKECIEHATGRVRELGPLLGPYHPVILDNVRRLREISGLDEVSFHMSGTEAVMQAVALARYHTRRKRLVRFCGAYHGWWDGVSPGPGNPRDVHDVFTLAECSDATLRVLETRRDIACVLVSPLQALHPNAPAPGDATLVSSRRRAHFDKGAYAAWLARVRDVCTRRGIAVILDEVFLGFRIARGGAQEYFGVAADLVTY